jgi:hypothetical protein
MTRREYTETPSSGAVVSFQTGGAPAAPNVPGVDFGGIRQSLNSWAQEASRKRQLAAQQRAQEQAITAQQELGAGELAEPDAEWDLQYQEAFQAAAAEVFVQNLEIDSTRVDNELRQEYFNNPQGYLSARQAYVDETLSGLQEQSVELHQIAKNSLDKQTGNSFSRLSEIAFQNEIQQNKDQAKLNFDLSVTQATQELLEPGADREMLVAERSGDLYAQLARDLDLGLITKSTYDKSLAAVDDTLYFASVRGDVQDALEQRNFGVVDGYIDDLERGVGVTLNLDAARSLANEIRVNANRVRSGTDSQTQTMLNNAKTEASILLSGGEPNEFAGSMRALQTMAMQSGDPAQMAAAQNILTDYEAATWVQQDLMTAGVEQLEEDVLAFASDPNLSESWRSSIVQKGNERIEEIRAAQGDPQAVRDLFPTLSYEDAARIGNVDPSIMPTYSTAQLEQQIPDAIARGNLYETLEELRINSRMGGNDLAATIIRSDALSEDEKGAAFTAVKLQQNGAMNLAAQAANLTGTMNQEQMAQFRKIYERSEEMAELIDAHSYYDPTSRALMQRGMALIAAGRLAETGQKSLSDDGYAAIAEQVVREFSSSADLVEIAGRNYPLMDFQMPGEGPIAARERAKILGEGIQEQLEAQGMSSIGIIIQPTENGGVEIFPNFGSSMRLLSPDGDTEWTFDEVAERNDRARLDAASQEDRIIEERNDPRWAESLNDRDPERYTAATISAVNARISEVSGRTGVEEPLLRAIVAASDRMTPAQRSTRDIPADRDPVRGARPTSEHRYLQTGLRTGAIAVRDALPNIYVFEEGIDGGDASFLQQGHWIRRTSEMFDNDPQKILAAYWSGRSAVEELVEEYGENWFDAATPSMKNFVRSGIGFYEQESFNYVPKSMVEMLPDPSMNRSEWIMP